MAWSPHSRLERDIELLEKENRYIEDREERNKSIQIKMKELEIAVLENKLVSLS